MKIVSRTLLLVVIWLTPALPLTDALAGQSARRATTARPGISAKVSFRCLWWSAEQMDGLNPNAPPPKSTEVTITKWEYSDPIGVPHPDMVEVVVDLHNESEVAADSIVVRLLSLWQVGPMKNRARAHWGKTTFLKTFPPAQLDARATHSLRIPVNLAEKMKSLAAKRSWPWKLRVLLSVSSASGRVLTKAVSDLPIIPGD